mmetsp:Transcript_87105/g.281249  ORF Transcript_87105/g.281249 Transcript_87105/m.281249 type:complete len:90 (-) Transcript_87105:65-334(-)
MTQARPRSLRAKSRRPPPVTVTSKKHRARRLRPVAPGQTEDRGQAQGSRFAQALLAALPSRLLDLHLSSRHLGPVVLHHSSRNLGGNVC